MDNEFNPFTLNKNDIIFKQLSLHEFEIKLNVCNENYNLCNIINFDLISVIFDLNKDIYEKTLLLKHEDNPNTCEIILLFKHFFKDIGEKQKHCHFFVNRNDSDNVITFDFIPQYNSKHELFNNSNSVHSEVKNMSLFCNTTNNSNVLFNLTCETTIIPPLFLTKFIAALLIKLINRIKVFIEKINV